MKASGRRPYLHLLAKLKYFVYLKMFTRYNFRMLLLYFVLLCSLPATFPLDPLTSGFKGKRSQNFKFMRN